MSWRGGVCHGGVGWGGVCHGGVGWGWGVSWRGGVGCVPGVRQGGGGHYSTEYHKKCTCVTFN